MRERELEFGLPSDTLVAAVARGQSHTIWLDGRGGFGDSWSTGPLLALAPRLSIQVPGGAASRSDEALRALEGILRRRRTRGGTAHTGVAVLLAYEALDRGVRPGVGSVDTPAIVVFEVDRTLRPLGTDGWVLSEVSGDRSGVLASEGWDRRLPRAEGPSPHRPARVRDRVRCSLGREAYLRAVQRVRAHIQRGDIYQANLCQRFTAEYEGDPLDLYAELVRTTPAPRSAFVSTPRFSLASVSPEIFLRGDAGGRVETWPIKGTRPRDDDPVRDLALARELESSEKDRAELLMIVDLERNDLGRVCRTGSIEVTRLAQLNSYAAVHHLVACIHGRLRLDVAWGEILRATFPGGSISGAPKIRARQILRELEPAPRGYFSGSLVWFGDDGSFDSSILIRTLVFAGATVFVGAGGGIVADSEPEQEWNELLLKARAPARALGFEPEEAR